MQALESITLIELADTIAPAYCAGQAALWGATVTTDAGSWKDSIFEAAAGYIGEEALNAACGGDTQRFGNSHPDMALHGVYRCIGEDEWVAIAVPTDKDFIGLSVTPTW
jgi:crotonobetainyl-CoA:carnitine CoA-transferase CaiB-like acyl-CoA transferase